MRRLLSSSFRNRLFAAFLAASLIPLLLCSALLLQIFRLRMEDRTQAEADRYLDSAVQALDQACQSLTSAAAALERDAVLSQALLQGSPTQGEVYRLFLEDVQSAQTLARLDLYDAIDRLDLKEQAVIRLRFFEDMKLEEIARATGANLNTVKSRLYKALKKLRDMTGEDLHDE